MSLLLFILAIPYLLIILVIITGLIFIKKSRVTDSGNTSVTVIIPARNEAERSGFLLQGILSQDYPSDLVEFIFIDDASDDMTGAVFQNFADTHPEKRITVIRKEIPGKKQAIEQAVKIASGKLLITTDADCHHPSTWISSIVKLYEDRRPKMITGPIEFETSDFFSSVQFVEFSGMMAATAGSASAGYPLMCNGANLAFEKEAFLHTGGFSGNEKYASGDDQFLMIKIMQNYGRRSVLYNIDRKGIVYTKPESSLKGFMYQRLRWVSKNKGIKNSLILFVAVATWVINFMIIAGLFVPQIFQGTVIVFFSKMILDFIAVAIMCFFFRKPFKLFLFPLVFLMNTVYVVLIGFLGMFSSFEWKGRRISN